LKEDNLSDIQYETNKEKTDRERQTVLYHQKFSFTSEVELLTSDGLLYLEYASSTFILATPQLIFSVYPQYLVAWVDFH